MSESKPITGNLMHDYVGEPPDEWYLSHGYSQYEWNGKRYWIMDALAKNLPEGAKKVKP